MRSGEQTIPENNPAVDAQIAHSAAIITAARDGFLPPGFDTEIFDREQLEYLRDEFAAEMHRLLRQFYRLLRAMPDAAEPSLKSVGLNAAILAKLFAVSEELENVTWDGMAAVLHVRRGDIFAQFAAIRDVIREIHPRTGSAIEKINRCRSARK